MHYFFNFQEYPNISKNYLQKYYISLWIEKNFRIYGTKSSMSLLTSNEITQYFTDCTYKCLSYEIKDNAFLLVMLGYNCVKDKFQLILIAILSHESSDVYTELYTLNKKLIHFFQIINLNFNKDKKFYIIIF